MFIGHIPAGFLWSHFLLSRLANDQKSKQSWRYYLAVGLVGSVLPDIDLIYFYLVDNGQHWHHSYWTHIPIIWFSLAIAALLIARIIKSWRFALCTILLSTNVLLHLILDTPVSGIKWLYPYSDNYLSLINVTAKYDWWVWNFIFHWYFLIEILVTLFAITVYYKTRSKEVTRKSLLFRTAERGRR